MQTLNRKTASSWRQVLTALFLTSFCELSFASDFFPSPLIKGDWLSSHIDEVLVLDVRKDLDTFNKEGHIEGAILVNQGKVRVTRKFEGKELTRMIPDQPTFQAFLHQLGVNNDSNVVLTHRGKTPGQVAGAARLYWQMKYYGFNNVAMLDGGNAAWVDALEDLVTNDTEVTAGDVELKEEHPAIFSTMAEVRAALNDPDTRLVDTRDLRQHIGIYHKDYVYAPGHIPGSANFPYKFLHAEKGAAKYFPVDKIRTIFEALNIDLNDHLILYCNSAFECSSVWFVLHEVMGKQDVSVYDGSLHQWTQYLENPMSVKLGQ